MIGLKKIVRTGHARNVEEAVPRAGTQLGGSASAFLKVTFTVYAHPCPHMHAENSSMSAAGAKEEMRKQRGN